MPVRRPVPRARPRRARNGPSSISVRTSSTFFFRVSAMPRTSCSYMSRDSDSVISRCAGREGGLRQLVGCGLVLADFLEVGLRAHLVQRALQKHFVGRDAGDVEAARGHEVDLVGGGREVVLPLAGIFEVGRDALAGLAEVEHGVAKFLNLSPVRRLERRRDNQHRVDTRVVFRAPQRIDVAPDSLRAHTSRQLAQDIVGGSLDELAAYAQHQRGVVRDGRPSPDDHPRADDGHNPEDDKQDERDSGRTSTDGAWPWRTPCDQITRRDRAGYWRVVAGFSRAVCAGGDPRRRGGNAARTM